MNKLLVIAVLSFSLAGCFTSEDELAEQRAECERTNTCDGPNTDVQLVQVTGTAATGLAMANATVTATNADGNNVATVTRSNLDGSFTIAFEESIPTPVLVTVSPIGGKVLQAIIDDPESRLVNVNPITNFVADRVLAEKSLTEVVKGDVKTAGDIALTQLFGTGVKFTAFASEDFTAKQTVVDFSEEISVADAVLDTLFELAGAQDIDEYLSQSTDLLSNPEFVVSVARHIAKLDGESAELTDIVDLESASAGLVTQLNLVSVFQDSAEQVVIQLSQTPGTNALIQSISVDSLVAIVAELAIVDGQLQTDNLDVLRTNVVDNLLDDILQFIASDVNQELSIEELFDKAEAVSEQIADIVQEQQVDLTQPDVDVTALEAAVQVVVSLDERSNWDQADWDTLTWK